MLQKVRFSEADLVCIHVAGTGNYLLPSPYIRQNELHLPL